MEKFKYFLKQEKTFIYGCFYLVVSCYFINFKNNIFDNYNIAACDRILVFMYIFFEITFLSKGFKLIFSKNDDQK